MKQKGFLILNNTRGTRIRYKYEYKLPTTSYQLQTISYSTCHALQSRTTSRLYTYTLRSVT